ncbi:unnamed protein product [Symbiodinium sp. CCMP2592]|nr:unnamed protein product [Symbiodinium sp. CCMP2592]
MPVMKKPAGKRPAACTELKKKNPKLSKEALENHQKFMKECGKKDMTVEQVDEAMKNASNKTQMSLWKAFETSRIAEGHQDEFLKASGSVGSTKKKRKMLSSWILDGGKFTKHYKQAIQNYATGAPRMLRAKQQVKWIWLSRTEAERRIGAEELKDRVQRKTIVWRRNPEDQKYFQFRFAKESDEVWTEKSQQRRGFSEAASTKEDMLEWKRGMKEGPVMVDDFDFEEGSGDEVDPDEDPLGLATTKGRGRKEKEEGGKEEKRNKWENESQASRCKLAASTCCWVGKPLAGLVSPWHQIPNPRC